MLILVRKRMGNMSVASLVLLAAIGLAGALGAVARYLLGRYVAERSASSFPLGTLIINITGAFLIGLIFALATRKLISPTLQATLATGFMGGFTTFSTMSWEGMQLARAGRSLHSLFYLGITFALGLSAVLLGLVLGRAIS